MNLLISIHRQLLLILSKLEWVALLLARITVGWVFAESGWGKVNNIGPVIEFFTSLNLPAAAFQANLVAYTELIAGALIIIGLATRYAAVPLIITMIVAVAKVTAPNASSLSDYFAASEFLYIVILAWLVFAGAGRASLDYLVRRKFFVSK
ncbi:MAG: DoxX family protein [Bdellovibrionota bacterium]